VELVVRTKSTQNVGVLDAVGNEPASYLCGQYARSIEVSDSGWIVVGLSGGGVRVLQVSGPAE
jgi:hypothetical protein